MFSCCFCCLSIICFIDTAQHLLWSLAVRSYVGLVCIVYFVWKQQCFLCCCTLQPNACQNVAEMLFRGPSSGQPASPFQNRAHGESRLWVLTTLSLKFCCLSKNTPHSEAVLYLLTRHWVRLVIPSLKARLVQLVFRLKGGGDSIAQVIHQGEDQPS